MLAKKRIGYISAKSIHRKNSILSFQMHITLSVRIPCRPMYRRIYLLYCYHFLESIMNHYSVLLTVLTGFGHAFLDYHSFSPARVNDIFL